MPKIPPATFSTLIAHYVEQKSTLTVCFWHVLFLFQNVRHIDAYGHICDADQSVWGHAGSFCRLFLYVLMFYPHSECIVVQRKYIWSVETFENAVFRIVAWTVKIGFRKRWHILVVYLHCFHYFFIFICLLKD